MSSAVVMVLTGMSNGIDSGVESNDRISFNSCGSSLADVVNSRQ